VPFLLEGAAWGRASIGRRAATQALAQLTRGRRDREAREVREHTERLLEDRDFRVQAAAIEALGVIGDPGAVGALKKVLVRELDGRLRRRAAEVIRDLDESRAPQEELVKLRDDFGQLRDTVVKLRDQVERLQLDAAHRAAESPRKTKKPKKPEKPKKKRK
jgi:HEAT repeat protein